MEQKIFTSRDNKDLCLWYC